MEHVDYFHDRLNGLGDEILQAIKDLLLSVDIVDGVKVHIHAYYSHGIVESPIILADGFYGKPTFARVRTISIKDDNVLIDLVETETDDEGEELGQYKLSLLNTVDRYHLLKMLTDIVRYSRDKHLPILEDRQTFDRWK